MEDNSEWFKLKESEERGDESNPTNHPFTYMTFEQILIGIRDIQESYGELFEDFEFRKETKSYGYGARTEWYELWGKARDPDKYRILYGSSKK